MHSILMKDFEINIVKSSSIEFRKDNITMSVYFITNIHAYFTIYKFYTSSAIMSYHIFVKLNDQTKAQKIKSN